MHEVSLIQSLLETVVDSAYEHRINKVTAVKLVVGENYGALPDALEFAFQVLTRGTVCQDAELLIEKKPVLLECARCGKEFRPNGLTRRCPGCGAGNTVLTGGNELYIDYYEGD